MNITTLGSAPVAAPGLAPGLAPGRADDATGASSFAGVLAAFIAAVGGAPAPAIVPAVPQADGTSELDQSEVPEDAKDSASVGVSLTAADATTATMPSLALAAAAARASAPATGIVRSVATLDPELQTKLARVISRVAEETGHDVTVAETYRSQPRQDALYAQGRETAGPVVTWTQASKHSQGRAADLVLDSSAGPAAYKILQRIANEEGLRTLGARDPGHVELPGSASMNLSAPTKTALTLDGTPATLAIPTTYRSTSRTSAVTPSIPVAPADASGPGKVSIARLAQVAQVAQVGQTAQVAQVAGTKTERAVPVTRLARGTQTVQTAQTASDAPGTSVAGAVGRVAAQSGKNGSSAQDRGAQGDSRSAYSALGSGLAFREPSTTLFPTQAVAPTTGSDAVARAERVMSAVENAPARSLSQLTMSVDGPNGTTDRIHVALRGSSLNATIDTADNRAAQMMSARTEELSRALSKDGIELDALRVRATTNTAGVTGASSAQAGQGSSNASAQSRFDRGEAHQQQQDQQDRQRSQQERNSSRQQQRQQRGGKE